MAQHTVSSRNDEKQRALSLALGQIEKQYGKGAIMRLGESQIADIPVIPTGSLALDAALGVGVCRADASWRSMDRKPPARQRWPYT